MPETGGETPRAARQGRPRGTRLFLLGVLAALILAAAACVTGFFWLRGQYLSAGPAAAASRIEVGSGASLRSVLARLEADGSIRNAHAVEWYLRLRAQQPRIQAGTYEIAPHASPAQIITLFEQGRVILEQLTVVEGATFADFLAALDQHPHVAHTLGGKSPAEIMAALGHPGQAAGRRILPRYLSLRGQHCGCRDSRDRL